MAVSPCGFVGFCEGCWGTCDVGEDVPIPADELLNDDSDEEDCGRVFGEFIELPGFETKLCQVLITLRRNIVVVLLDVIGIDVVSSVGALPGEVWCQEPGVESPSDGIVDHTVL